MNKNSSPIYGLIAVALVGFFLFVGISMVLDRPSAPVGLAEIPIQRYTTASTTVVSTASQLVVSTTSARRYLKIQNDGGVKAYCSVNDLTAVDRTGFVLTSTSSPLELYGDTNYIGAIRCIASSSVNLLVVQATY